MTAWWPANGKPPVRDRRLRRSLALLSPLPVVLLADLFQRLQQDDGRGFLAVEGDRSLIEVLGYAQATAAVVLLAALALRSHAPVYAGWAVLFVGVIADDAGQLHEIGGERLARTDAVTAVVGLRAEDVGELLVWGGLGTLLLSQLAVAAARTDAVERRRSWRLAVPLALLAFFAVGVDMVNSALHAAPPAVRLLGSWTEASGELMALTVLLVLALELHQREPALAGRARGRAGSAVASRGRP